MTEKTLFLSWQDQHQSREWFPVGQLDISGHGYRFHYIKGAERAHAQAGLEPLVDFPDWNRTYESAVLFPLFMNRVMQEGRPDYREYLQMLDLPRGSGVAEILTVGGGRRATDNFEVFPKLERRPNGSFESRFFLHGWSHVNDDAQRRIDRLKSEEKLYVTIELTNPVVRLAVQIQTEDYYMIGWAPRYLVTDLVQAIAHAPGMYTAKVVRVNPAPAPSRQRLLVELTGFWPDQYVPMTGPDFETLAA
jgi:hypothetical protein